MWKKKRKLHLLKNGRQEKKKKKMITLNACKKIIGVLTIIYLRSIEKLLILFIKLKLDHRPPFSNLLLKKELMLYFFQRICSITILIIWIFFHHGPKSMLLLISLKYWQYFWPIISNFTLRSQNNWIKLSKKFII